MYIRKIIWFFINVNLLTILLMGFFSCADKENVGIKYRYDKETIPTVTAYNDTILVTDSGFTRFKVIAEKMMIFDQASDPYTFFPDKAYLEQYDTLKNIVTVANADSVWNFSKRKFWKLKGNVRIVNEDGQIIEAEEVFWDQPKDKIYSERHVTIWEDDGSVSRARDGFTANQRMTNVVLRGRYDSEYYFYESQDTLKVEKDSLNR